MAFGLRSLSAGGDDEDTLLAHAGILRAASPVLDAMLSGCMQEAAGRQLHVENATSMAVKVFLALMYTGSLPLDLEPTCHTILEAKEYGL